MDEFDYNDMTNNMSDMADTFDLLSDDNGVKYEWDEGLDESGADDTNAETGHGYPFDRQEWAHRGMNAIELNMDAIRDDYLDK